MKKEERSRAWKIYDGLCKEADKQLYPNSTQSERVLLIAIEKWAYSRFFHRIKEGL